MSSFQYYQFLRFLFQLLLPVSMFLLSMPRRKYFLFRLVGFFGSFLLLFWGIISLLKLMPRNLSDLSSIIYYTLLFLYLLLGIFFCFDVPWSEALFAGMGGYALQHLTFSLVGIFQACMNYYKPGALDALPTPLFDFLIRFLPYMVVSALSYFIFIRKHINHDFVKRDPRISLLSVFLLATVVVLSIVSQVRIFDRDGSFRIRLCMRCYAILCCVSVLWLQYTVSYNYLAKKDNETMEHLLSQEKKQHELMKENINIISIKCHDLKKQLSILKENPGTVDKEQIKEIEDKVYEYEHTVSTGNEILDIILTEENYKCFRNNIRLNMNIASGRMDFMKKSDILSLFSNMIDNAVESIQRENETRREISLTILGHDDITIITCANPFSGKIDRRNGIIQTRKRNPLEHGYGLKSIRYIVARYNGSMEIEEGKQEFVLKIYFGSISSIKQK